jgi:uncharacterized protein YegL
VTTSFRGVGSAAIQKVFDANAPSVLLFSDTPADRPQYLLATVAEVGSVWGLAYRSSESSVYAAAYHKVQLPFGPGGPGAIYRLDLVTGEVTHAFSVPNAGPDYHEDRITEDKAAARWAGRASLGDIDLSEDESILYAVNMADGRVYRLSMPSGDVLGSFAHGASGEDWAAVARPFGLAVRDGHVFHAVVRTAADSLKREELSGHVYRSNPDGSAMTEVLAFALDFDRGRIERRPPVSLDWQPWRDSGIPSPDVGNLVVYPMPMLSDLSFDGAGNLVLGFRDRLSDSMQHFASGFGRRIESPVIVGAGVGDIVRATASDALWSVDVASEHYDDAIPNYSDEMALGGLARIPHSDVTVSTVNMLHGGGGMTENGAGALWFDNSSGNRTRKELVGSSRSEPLRAALSFAGVAHAHCPDPPTYLEVRAPGSLGDVEVICAPEVPPTAKPTLTDTPGPTGAPTITPVSPTATATPTTTPTAMSTPTATPLPGPIHLPIALKERCDPDRQRADVALVLDTSSSMAGAKIEGAKAAALTFVGVMDLAEGRDQVAIVRFDAESEVAEALTSDRTAIEVAVRGLQVRQGTRIDKGLLDALAELRSERRSPVNTAVAVLLTDGIHNGEPGAELAAAREVRDAGIRLYTIGLGADVDGAALAEMAGDARRYYFAPNSGDLARIYGEIARDLMCPDVDLWGGAR